MTPDAASQRRSIGLLCRQHGLNALLAFTTSIAVVAVARNVLMVLGPRAGNPSIGCHHPTRSVGRAESGKVIEQSFEVSNNGGRVLIVTGIASDCRCTRVTPTSFPQEIPPGKTLPIVARMDPHDLKGLVRKRLFVFSNDLQNPRFQLTIEAEIFDGPEH